MVGHVFDAECTRARRRTRIGAIGYARIGSLRGPKDVHAGPVPVVVDGLRQPVAVGIKHLADVREAVPLRRILQMQDREIVADHVGMQRVIGDESIVEIGFTVAHCWSQNRRVTARIQYVPTREIERKTQAERTAGAHFGDALAHLFRRQQVEAAELIVATEVAPRRARWAVLPARFSFAHRLPPWFRSIVSQCFILRATH
jgi:hypothetical protein